MNGGPQKYNLPLATQFISEGTTSLQRWIHRESHSRVSKCTRTGLVVPCPTGLIEFDWCVCGGGHFNADVANVVVLGKIEIII